MFFYKQKNKIGQNQFLVEDIKSGINYILRLRPKKQISQEGLEQYIQGEIKCMKELDSPNIVKFYQEGEDEDNHYIIEQYCERGSLQEYQEKLPDQIFSLQHAIKVLAQVISAVEHMHSKNYVHRNIKLQNIKVKQENNKQIFKLSAFFYSKKIEDISGTILGSPPLMSPEIWANKEHYGYQVDVWAFGVISFNQQIYVTQGQFERYSLYSQDLKKWGQQFSYATKVGSTSYNWKLNINCTREVEDFFNRVFRAPSQKRITFKQMKKHPLFKKQFFSQTYQGSPSLYGPYLSLNKYLIIYQIGHQAFLIENDNHERNVLKLYNHQHRMKGEYTHLSYSRHISSWQLNNQLGMIKTLKVQKDENYMYFLKEYYYSNLSCLQYDQQNQVFELKPAVLIMVEIIKALEKLHLKQIPQRKIRPDNIGYIKIGKQKIFKFINRGYVSISEEINRRKQLDFADSYRFYDTFSPQMFHEGIDKNSFQLHMDIWNLGRLMYFMLNKQYPFYEKKTFNNLTRQNVLNELTGNFSYRSSVKQSKNKIIKNCSSQIQDLFSRFFEVNPYRRITLTQLKSHPVFSAYFETINNNISCLSPSIISYLQKISFYGDCAKILAQKGKFFQKKSDHLMLTYCLIKRYIILLKQFEEAISNQDLGSICPQYNQLPKATEKQTEFALKEISKALADQKLKLAKVYDSCQPHLPQIAKINRHFEKGFERAVKSSINSDFFQLSYKTAATYAYGKIREAMRSNNDLQIGQQLFMLAFIQVFDRLVADPNQIKSVFKQFILDENLEEMNFQKFWFWLNKPLGYQSHRIRNDITRRLLRLYFA